ncbi:MAG: TatD family hydrolase [Halobacteriota archaeon]|nr:TatD family hydrolase [Halobacteriota archaeon]
MIDTHCHLTFKQFETDKDEVIESAKKVLSKVIVSGTEPEDSVRSLALHEEHPDFISIALGLHPKFAVEIKGKELEEYFEFIKENKDRIVGIGEIGLDYYWIKDPLKVEKSKRIFEECLNLAKELKLPAILHMRDAIEEGFEMVLDKDVKRAVFHCYSGKRSLAEQIAEEGYYISIPTSIVRSKNMKKSVRGVPLTSLLAETDAPYLSPEEGKRNIPQNVKVVYEKIAEARDMPLNEVINTIDENCSRIFNF